MIVALKITEVGYTLVIARWGLDKAEPLRKELIQTTGNANIEVPECDLASFALYL